MHTPHPCTADGCTSQPWYVLVDPDHFDPRGRVGYDAIRAIVTERRIIAGLVSRSFGAETFDSAEAAMARRDSLLELASTLPVDPFGIELLERAVPVEWGTRHTP